MIQTYKNTKEYQNKSTIKICETVNLSENKKQLISKNPIYTGGIIYD